ncbi:MAG: hypothetical protein BWY32_01007 [bacterium ADurb.Bin243]|nr:MAG: hypothetical protein BWY32_01007 [bacterium ADurb.Bin243]
MPFNKLRLFASIILVSALVFIISCGGGGGGGSSPAPPYDDQIFTFEGSIPQSASNGAPENVFRASDFTGGRYSIVATDRYLNNELVAASVSGSTFSLRFSPARSDSFIMITVKENATNRFLYRNLIGRIPKFSEIPAGLKSVKIKNIEINDFSTSLALFCAEKNIDPPPFINLSAYQGETSIVKNYDEIKNISQTQIVNNAGGLANVLELARACVSLMHVLTSDSVSADEKNQILPPPRNIIEASGALEAFVYALQSTGPLTEIKAKGLSESVSVNKTVINSVTAPASIKAVIDSIKSLDKVANPVFSAASGTYDKTFEVAIVTATSGAKIYYTADGKVPNSSSTLYQAPILIDKTQKISAIAVKSEMIESDVVSQNYTLNIIEPPKRVSAPVFDPPPGTYQTGYEVKISTSTGQALIYYTTDSSDPVPGVSRLYSDSSPVILNSSLTLKAVAVKQGYLNSSVTGGAYEAVDVPLKASAPVFSVAPGVYNSTREVDITTATAGASIYYTLDGSEPNLNSILYSKPVVVAKTLTIKAYAVKAGMLSSAPVSAAYEIIKTSTAASAPEFNYESGIYENTLEVLLSSKTPGAEIYYTLDHSAPSADSLKYSGTIEISATTTVKAIAIKTGYANSEVSTAEYTLNIHNPANIAKVTGLFYYSVNKIIKWSPVAVEGKQVEYAVRIDGNLMPQYLSRPEFSVAMFMSGSRTVQVQAKIAGSLHPLDFGPLSDIYKFTIKASSDLPQVTGIDSRSGYFNWQPLADAETVYGYRVMFDDDISNLFITRLACYGVPPGLVKGPHKLRVQAVTLDESDIQITVTDEGPWSVEYSFFVEDGTRPYESIPYPENFGYEPTAKELKWSLNEPVSNFIFHILASYDRPSGNVYSKLIEVVSTDSVSLEMVKNRLPMDSFNCVLEVCSFDGFNYSMKSAAIKLPVGDLPEIGKVGGIAYNPASKILTWQTVYANEQPCVYRVKVDGYLSGMVYTKNEYNAAALRSGTHEVLVQAVLQTYNPELNGPFSDPFDLFIDTSVPQVMGLAYVHSRKLIRWLPVVINEQICFYRVKVDGREAPNLSVRSEYSVDALSPGTHEISVRAVIADTSPEINGPYSEVCVFNTQVNQESGELPRITQIQLDSYNSILRWQPVLVDKLPIASYVVELDGVIMTHNNNLTYTASASYGISENVSLGPHTVRVKPILAGKVPPVEGQFSEPVQFYLQRNDALFKKVSPSENLIFDEQNQTLYWDKAKSTTGTPTYNVIGYFNTGANISEQSFPIQETRLNLGVLKFDPRFLSMPSGKYSIEVQSGLIENSKAKGLKTPAIILDLTDERRWENIK